MFDKSAISRLYANVLEHDIGLHRLTPSNIKGAIKFINGVYRPESSNLQSNFPLLADFNDAAFRCAYLHKYAPLHTYVVLDAMVEILNQEMLRFRELVMSKKFEFCSLGGGPGSDVVGVLAALHAEFGNFESSVTVVDCMKEWESTFRSVLFELRSGNYGRTWENLNKYVHCKYIAANLLQCLTSQVKTSIASSSLITMIKFLSAARCKNTDSMIEIIFNTMKPGALLLFIDNDSGGFFQLIKNAAEKNRFTILFGLRHVFYEEITLNIERFGYRSCSSTTVTILLLQKPLNRQEKRRCPSLCEDIPNEKTPLLRGQRQKRRRKRKINASIGVVSNKTDSQVKNRNLDSLFPFLSKSGRNIFNVCESKNNENLSYPECESVKSDKILTLQGKQNEEFKVEVEMPSPQCSTASAKKENVSALPNNTKIEKSTHISELQSTKIPNPIPNKASKTDKENKPNSVASKQLQKESMTDHTSASKQPNSDIRRKVNECEHSQSKQNTALQVNTEYSINSPAKLANSDKLPTVPTKLTAKFHEKNFRTFTLPAQKQNKVLCRDILQKEQTEANSSNTLLSITSSAEKLQQKGFQKSALEKKPVFNPSYSLITTQATSDVGTNKSATLFHPSEQNTTQKDPERSKMTNSHKPVLHTKFPEVHSKSTSKPEQKNKPVPEVRDRKVPNSLNTLRPVNPSPNPQASPSSKDMKGKLVKNSTSNFSSITAPPDSVARVNQTKNSSEGEISPTSHEDDSIQNVCCSCLCWPW